MRNYLLVSALTSGLLMSSASIVSAANAESGFKDRSFVFTSVNDPDVEPDQAFCADAPFQPSAVLGASLWSMQSRLSNSIVIDDQVLKVGTATACLELDQSGLEPDGLIPIYVQFKLDRIKFTGVGLCRTTTIDVPVADISLTGCSVEMVDIPRRSRTIGGMASSSSVLNPTAVPGFNTGSVWLMRTFKR